MVIIYTNNIYRSNEKDYIYNVSTPTPLVTTIYVQYLSPVHMR